MDNNESHNEVKSKKLLDYNMNRERADNNILITKKFKHFNLQSVTNSLSGARITDFILAKIKNYQIDLVEILDIEQLRKNCFSKKYNNIDADTLLIAYYLNQATMKAADEFLVGCFEGLNEVELLETTGRLLSSLKEQFLLTDEFNLHLKYQRGIAFSDTKQAGEIVDEYSLNDIFNDGVDEGFNEHSLINRFQELYGKSKVTEYLETLEANGVQLRGDSDAVNAIRELTDKHYLFDERNKLGKRKLSSNQ
ncbi:hypothetical protein [Shewanella colwelliana]|uniref:hypothetical protein n=1 Tax=Shewanella colwelliana TaxID=23 RepID=UPI00048A79F2|nr:hypothetical protein [Shewanella colwelliana]